MKKRKELIVWLFEKSQYLYTRCIKRSTPWEATKQGLLQLPDGSLGNALGHFLLAQ